MILECNDEATMDGDHQSSECAAGKLLRFETHLTSWYFEVEAGAELA